MEGFKGIELEILYGKYQQAVWDVRQHSEELKGNHSDKQREQQSDRRFRQYVIEDQIKEKISVLNLYSKEYLYRLMMTVKGNLILIMFHPTSESYNTFGKSIAVSRVIPSKSHIEVEELLTGDKDTYGTVYFELVSVTTEELEKDFKGLKMKLMEDGISISDIWNIQVQN